MRRLAVFGAILTAGCQTGVLPDVNVPGAGQPLAMETAWKDLQSFGDGTY